VKPPLTLSDFPLAPPAAAPQFIHMDSDSSDRSDALQELGAGLSAEAARVSPKYFYDALGSKLFEAITGLAEYYPTRTEAAIFEASHAHIAAALAQCGLQNPCLIDLGAATAPRPWR
jgi:uncharacterized SAM-dependent methyltransferase